ncbi:hypothetical protein [Photobacterium kasasachensis]|uniref:hypothetical protein n=1 Tax=Photobacterium kasasachensis TaxID=2910240 RepID=UPI003D09F483
MTSQKPGRKPACGSLVGKYFIVPTDDGLSKHTILDLVSGVNGKNTLINCDSCGINYYHDLRPVYFSDNIASDSKLDVIPESSDRRLRVYEVGCFCVEKSRIRKQKKHFIFKENKNEKHPFDNPHRSIYAPQKVIEFYEKKFKKWKSDGCEVQFNFIPELIGSTFDIVTGGEKHTITFERIIGKGKERRGVFSCSRCTNRFSGLEFEINISNIENNLPCYCGKRIHQNLDSSFRSKHTNNKVMLISEERGHSFEGYYEDDDCKNIVNVAKVDRENHVKLKCQRHQKEFVKLVNTYLNSNSSCDKCLSESIRNHRTQSNEILTAKAKVNYNDEVKIVRGPNGTIQVTCFKCAEHELVIMGIVKQPFIANNIHNLTAKGHLPCLCSGKSNLTREQREQQLKIMLEQEGHEFLGWLTPNENFDTSQKFKWCCNRLLNKENEVLCRHKNVDTSVDNFIYGNKRCSKCSRSGRDLCEKEPGWLYLCLLSNHKIEQDYIKVGVSRQPPFQRLKALNNEDVSAHLIRVLPNSLGGKLNQLESDITGMMSTSGIIRAVKGEIPSGYTEACRYNEKLLSEVLDYINKWNDKHSIDGGRGGLVSNMFMNPEINYTWEQWFDNFEQCNLEQAKVHLTY